MASFFLVFIIGELFSFLLFKVINRLFGNAWEFRFNSAVLKGMLERFFLFLVLVENFPHGLIAFGAIKIGTRIKPDFKITNDYFFIGNIVSMILAVCYYIIWKGIP